LIVGVVPIIVHIIVVVIGLLLLILNPRLGIAIRLAGIVVTRGLSTHDAIPWKGKRVVNEGRDEGNRERRKDQFMSHSHM
jgi:hypothetical protein